MMQQPYCENTFSVNFPFLAPDGLRILHSAKMEKPMPLRIDFSHEVAFEIAAVPEVQAVFTSQLVNPDRQFFVWTIVPKRDLDLYRRIFQQEQSIIGKWSPLHFDFTIMPSDGKEPTALVTDPSARLAYIKRAE
jgi:hypothetical protein